MPVLRFAALAAGFILGLFGATFADGEIDRTAM